jgi:hypothetical protein
MFLPFPGSLWFANSWFMKSPSVNPRCLNTPCSRYWQKTTSSLVSADAVATDTASSPADNI